MLPTTEAGRPVIVMSTPSANPPMLAAVSVTVAEFAAFVSETVAAGAAIEKSYGCIVSIVVVEIEGALLLSPL